MQLHWNLFLIFLPLIGGINRVSGWNEVDIVRVGSLVNSSKVVNYDFYAKKINRTTCALSGNLEMLVDFNEADAYQVNI